jgi:hypothetical protein
VINPRERRTIAAGLTIGAFALVIAFGVLPFARRWYAREKAIAAEREHVARLRGLVGREADLRRVLDGSRGTLEAGVQRLLSGRTPALVASSLQSLLQSYADQSQVTVTRLDVTGEAVKNNGMENMPATVSAIGDVYGVTQLLYLIQHGSRLLEISELTVRPNPALRGELLQLTVTLRGPFVTEATP